MSGLVRAGAARQCPAAVALRRRHVASLALPAPRGRRLPIVELGLSVSLAMVVFAMIYKTMPRARIAWSDVWIGAAFTAVLFISGKSAIGAYIGRTGVSTAFGAAAALVVVLLWVYYSAQIFLFGAEFTWVYSHRFGSRRPVTQSHG